MLMDTISPLEVLWTLAATLFWGVTLQRWRQAHADRAWARATYPPGAVERTLAAGDYRLWAALVFLQAGSVAIGLFALTQAPTVSNVPLSGARLIGGVIVTFLYLGGQLVMGGIALGEIWDRLHLARPPSVPAVWVPVVPLTLADLTARLQVVEDQQQQIAAQLTALEAQLRAGVAPDG